MSDVTKIEWTDHSFNPWWGCSRVSPACRFCYADRDAQRYGHQVWRRHGPRRMLSEGNWQKPLKWNRDAERAGIPAKVFCASMADVFEDHPDVEGPRRRLWDTIERTPHLTWQLLTKRPENIAQMIPSHWRDNGWPPSVWAGTSVENQRYADERITLLAEGAAGAAVLFLSCEPLLGPVDLTPWLGGQCGAAEEPSGRRAPHGDRGGLRRDDAGGLEDCAGRPSISWVIVGGESGPKARPMDPSWARALRDRCQVFGVPFFFKQFGEWAPTGSRAVGNLSDPRERFAGDDVDEHGCREVIRRVGKKAAGRLLDGQEWSQFPHAPAVPS